MYYLRRTQMCSNETHQNLSRPEHFTRHAMAVEQVCASVRHGIGNVAIENVMNDAQEALRLTDNGVSRECTRMLTLIVEGDLHQAAQIQ